MTIQGNGLYNGHNKRRASTFLQARAPLASTGGDDRQDRIGLIIAETYQAVKLPSQGLWLPFFIVRAWTWPWACPGGKHAGDFRGAVGAESREGYRGLVRAGAHRADAQDAVSEATIRAMDAFSHYDPGRASFTTWLSIIAYREWLRIMGRQRRFVRLDPERELAGDESIEDTMLRLRDGSQAEGTSEGAMQVLVERLLTWVQEREAANPCVPSPGRKYGVIIDELLERLEDGGSLRQVDVARSVNCDRATVSWTYAWLRGKVLEMVEEREDVMLEDGEGLSEWRR